MSRTILLAMLVLAIVLVPAVASACPVCYGAPNSPLTEGSNNAILFLLAVIVFVQIGFVAMFWSFWRRAKAMRRLRESFRLVDGGAAH